MSQPIQTLPTGALIVNHQSIDEILFAQRFLKAVIPNYRLDEITKGHVPRNINVTGAHPLAVVRGMIKPDGSFGGSMESMLPLIGIEQMTTTPEEIPLGVAETQKYTVDAAFIERLRGIPVDERAFPGEMIDKIDAIFKQKQDEGGNLFLYCHSLIKDTGVKISLWSADYEATRLIRKILESAMIEFYRAIQKYGVRPKKYTLEPNLYNFDFGETLFGCEFMLPFHVRNLNYLIDLNLQEIKEFDIGIFDTDSLLVLHPAGIPEQSFAIGK